MQMDMVPRLCRQTDILYYSQLDGNCKYIGYETRNRGKKSFTPVTKSSIFQKTEQTTAYHFPQILVTVFQFLRPQYDQRKAADLPINRFK